ncbi:MAG: DUF4126 domain-containing protein [Candidatus Polarisedimenticolia bacterium]
MSIAAAIAMGLALAACAGLRAFLPLLALAVAHRAGVLPLAPELTWLSSDPSLIVLASAVFFEVLGDKVPVVDHVLDSVGLVIRPLAGGAAAVVPFLSAGPDGSMIRTLSEGDWGAAAPWIAVGTGAVAGGSLTALVLLAKAALRVASSSFTLGLANPVLSLAEDGLGVTGVILALLVPIVALAMVAMGILLIVAWFRRRRLAPRV